MDYKNLYDQLIQKRKHTLADGYTELHHIIPRCLGGTDAPENLVALTAREHFMAHYLLSKMYAEDSFEWHKMNHALMMMKSSSSKQDRYLNSRLYESVKKNFRKVMSKVQSGKSNSQFGTRWIHSIDLKQSKRISKHDALPRGWQEGRKILFKEKVCGRCNQKFIVKANERFCTNECRIAARRSKGPLYGLEDEFIAAYKQYGSMNKALKELGFPGAISHWYKAAKFLLEKYDL